MNNSPRRTAEIDSQTSVEAPKGRIGSDFLARLGKIPGARALAVIAALAAAPACGEEETDEVCEADQDDLEGQGDPRIEPVQGGVESNGTNYRIKFNVPDFDATNLPDFDETCQKWPVIAAVRVWITDTGTDPAAQSTQRIPVLGEKLVYGPGEDSVEFVLPQSATATGTPTSYALQLYVPTEDGSTDGSSTAVLIFEGASQPLTNFAPGELPPGDPPTNP